MMQNMAEDYQRVQNLYAEHTHMQRGKMIVNQEAEDSSIFENMSGTINFMD